MPTVVVLNEVSENENEMDGSLSEEEKNTKNTQSRGTVHKYIYVKENNSYNL